MKGLTWNIYKTFSGSVAVHYPMQLLITSYCIYIRLMFWGKLYTVQYIFSLDENSVNMSVVLYVKKLRIITCQELSWMQRCMSHSWINFGTFFFIYCIKLKFSLTFCLAKIISKWLRVKIDPVNHIGNTIIFFFQKSLGKPLIKINKRGTSEHFGSWQQTS